MWVFLDIDGVLVPEKNFEKVIEREELWKFDPICLELLERILERHPEVSVGIASSWRDLFSLEKVRSLFSEKIGKRIRGFTPLLDSEEDEVYEYYRQKEVEEFLKRENASGQSWIVINQNRDYYPLQTNVVVTDAYNGFDEKAASVLEEYLLAKEIEEQRVPLCSLV